MEGLALFKMKEETAHRVRARDEGAPATLDSFTPTVQKSRMMVINLDQLASYEETAWNEQP
jgi:hypothetical protein